MFNSDGEKSRHMTAGLNGHLNVLSAMLRKGDLHPAEYDMIIEEIGSLYDRCEELIKLEPPGMDRAIDLHEEIDQLIASRRRKDNPPIQCKKGCSACCYASLPTITADEAALLASRIKTDSIEIDSRLLQSQAAFEGTTSEWARQSLGKSKCVFLSDKGECRVYRDRPTACRLYLVVSDPKDCAPPANKIVKKYFTADAEVLASAALNAARSRGPLPRMLLKALR